MLDMQRLKPLILLVIVLFTASSCDDEIFGPRTFQGVWKATEYDSDYNPMTFEVGIDYYPGDSSRILIGNFSNLGLDYDVTANLSGLDLTIPFQSVDGRGGKFRISGSGRASTNIRRIDLDYEVDGDEFTAVFTK
jgi:hypothetical protein